MHTTIPNQNEYIIENQPQFQGFQTWNQPSIQPVVQHAFQPIQSSQPTQPTQKLFHFDKNIAWNTWNKN